jgi:hypothetical protein
MINRIATLTKTKPFNSSIPVEPHKKMLVVNPEVTEYIPLCFLWNDLYLHPDMLTGGLSLNSSIPVFIRDDNSSSGAFNNAAMYDKRSMYFFVYGGWYLKRACVLDNTGVVYCTAIKTDYVISLFNDMIAYILNSKTYEIFKDSSFFTEADNRMALFYNLSISFFNEEVFVTEMEEQCTTFINRKEYTRFRVNYSKQLDYVTGRPTDKVRVLEDTDTDYFNSKCFATVELPTFKELDGPEKMVQELIREKL